MIRHASIQTDSRLVVHKSSLRNAGMGVFCKNFIPAECRVGEYVGTLISQEEYDDLEDEACDYIMELNYPRVYLDASPDKGGNTLSYINGAKSRKQHKLINCRFYQYRHRMFVKTTTNVFVGQELIADYGDEYW